MWQNFFDKIFVINLPKRTDRKERIIELFEKYNISCFFWDATEHEHGYFGLVLTMKNLCNYCKENGYKKILVFEDDVDFLVGVEELDMVMNKCVESLNHMDWDAFYLGVQHVHPFNDFVRPNILRVISGYSTHAVAYNSKAINFFIEETIDEPIDNALVRILQPHNQCYCSYPLLATQIPGFSDIGNEYFNWDRYIQDSYRKAILPLISRK